MALVKLYKRQGTYKDKHDGKEKSFTNFYVECGDKLIPVEITYFANPEHDNRDYQYAGRKAVMEAFAETLPERTVDEKADKPA